MTLCVQYGCGFNAPPGWVNFDSSPTLRFERLPFIGGTYTRNATRFPPAVRYGDIVKGLPIEPNSVDKLYASHVLEHLAHEDAVIALKNSHLILKSGGIFRVIVPDLTVRVRKYLSDVGSVSAAPEFLDSTLLGRRSRARGILNIASTVLGNSNHLWMWDEPSLTHALKMAGFSDIRRCTFGDSGDSDFVQVEQMERFIAGDIVELALQCKKP